MNAVATHPAAATYTFADWLSTLARASSSELVHLALVNAEGSDSGDAAFAVLAGRVTIMGAHAAIAAEKAARELDVWTQRMETVAANAIAMAA